MQRERSLRLLLIEDNPGDARYIEELLREATELSVRVGAGGGDGERADDGGGRPPPTLLQESRLADGIDRLEEEDVDAVLLDLDLPDSNGLETLSTVVDHTDGPVVVLTGHRDRETGLAALREGAEEYLVKSEINSDLLIRSVYHAIERRENERELKRYEVLIEESTDVNAVLDPDGTIRYVTPSAESVLGYDPDSVVGDNAFEYVHPEDREEAIEALQGVIEREWLEPIEFRFRHADGSWVVLEARSRNLRDDPLVDGIVVYTRDVTERKRYEDTLKGLNESSRELLAATSADEVSRVTAAATSGLLDLPGVAIYRYDDERDLLVLDESWSEDGFMRRSIREVEPDEDSIVGEAFVEGRSRLYDDVTEASNGLIEPEDTEMRGGLFVPVGGHAVLIAGSREVGGFDDRTRQLVELLGANAETAYDRVERERDLERQREQLATLNQLNRIVQEITHAVIESESRGELEAAVCEHLVEPDSYRLAWIGEVDAADDGIAVRTSAGAEGYLEDVEISVSEGATGQGPSGRAVRTGTMQITQDLLSDPDFEPWREQAREHGFRSSAAIPIEYEGTLFGVLNVYSERPEAFGDDEADVIGQLGGIVGHAINAIERKEAYMSQEVVEVEFTVPGYLDVIGVEGSGSIAFDRVIPLGDGRFAAFGTATDAKETLQELVEAVPNWEELTIVAERDEEIHFELALSTTPFLSAIESAGGRIPGAVIEDGAYNLVVHLPPSADVRAVVNAMQETHAGAELIAQRRTPQSTGRASSVQQVFEERLTLRQQSILEAAYFAGYFQWPRESTGEEVAAMLDVSAPTFHQHLRNGERELLTAVFETAGSSS